MRSPVWPHPEPRTRATSCRSAPLRSAITAAAAFATSNGSVAGSDRSGTPGDGLLCSLTPEDYRGPDPAATATAAAVPIAGMVPIRAVWRPGSLLRRHRQGRLTGGTYPDLGAGGVVAHRPAGHLHDGLAAVGQGDDDPPVRSQEAHARHGVVTTRVSRHGQVLG